MAEEWGSLQSGCNLPHCKRKTVVKQSAFLWSGA